MKISDNKKIILYCTIMALVLIIFVLSQMILYSYLTSDTKILPGVYINGYYVGGKTKDEAAQIISDDLAEFLLNNETQVINGETSFTIEASQIADVDVESLVNEAYNAHRENVEISYFEFIKMKFSPVDIKSPTILDWYRIYDAIELNQHIFYKAPTDAKLMDYSFVEGQLKIVTSPHNNGYRIDVHKSASAVQQALVDHTPQVNAVMESIPAEITSDMLLKLSHSPSAYSQVFPVEAGGRYYNVPKDFEKLEGLINPLLIMPGQSISIKELVDYDNYKPSIKDLKNVHIPSVIYGCALQVGLTVSEHHVSDHITNDMLFYPYGQEAILSDTDDLVLTNNFMYPVIINLKYDSSAETHRLVCQIYSVQTLEYTYTKSVIEEHDNLYYVKVYRVYANDTGGVLSRTLLEQHVYPIPKKDIKPQKDETEKVEEEVVEPQG